jgi:hypothetical protein
MINKLENIMRSKVFLNTFEINKHIRAKDVEKN